MRILSAALAACLMSGCATQVISSNARQVIVKAGTSPLGPDGVAPAQKLAEAECAKHGRYARLVGRPELSPEYVFDCVQ